MSSRHVAHALSLSLVVLVAACRQTSGEAAPDPIASSTPVSPPAVSASAAPSAAAAASAPPAPGALTRVEASKVCMVNNQYMEVEQIPVSVAGKTYFGCCAMCKTKLENDEGVRNAVDPVSGARVDKATAVIGRDASNRVHYFESEATMRRFVL